MFILLGTITVTSGTPVDLFANRTDLRGKGQLVNSLYFQVGKDNTDDVYIGQQNLSIGGDTGIISILRPPTANFLTEVTMEITNQPNPYSLDSFRIDGGHTNDIVRVTAQVY
jgi:hypothetical protein